LEPVAIVPTEIMTALEGSRLMSKDSPTGRNLSEERFNWKQIEKIF
jgi:hypothetical protein